MNLVSLDSVSLEYGDTPLLTRANLSIEYGERVAVIGRNGAGKTSLLRVLASEIDVDGGVVRFDPNVSVAKLDQHHGDQLDQTVFDYVASEFDAIRKNVSEYERLSANPGDNMEALAALEKKIEITGGWQIDQRVTRTLTELSLARDIKLAALSGGWQRRAALAKALVSQPKLLLLDEPTNHLDLSTINWLENLIKRFQGSVVFITHDREFLRRIATRIVELDIGNLTSWPGDYDQYLRRKEKALEDEARDAARRDKLLAQEEKWIRQGIKARRTRNEGRVRALKKLRAERSARLERGGKAEMSISEGEKGSRRVVELYKVYHRRGDRQILSDLSLTIRRGDRIGIIGNNGVGKSTLLSILVGESEPDRGSVKLGAGVEIGYFDQGRRSLDMDQTVAVAVGGGRETVTVDGRDRHIISYLKSFLFSPARAQSPLASLSGGELNRVVLANLFLKPINLMILDEPTNDLDIETLEILEAKLVEYAGTLVVVSHDRVFLDNVVTSVLVFEDNDRIEEYVGGYSDWLRRGRTLAEQKSESPIRADPSAAAAAPVKKLRPTASELPQKLTYAEKLELDALPEKIDELEKTLVSLREEAATTEFYNQDKTVIQAALAEMKRVDEALEAQVARWGALEEIRENYANASRK